MTFADDLDKAINTWKDTDNIIDLTDPKTFVVASTIAIACGIMIGVGYHMVFVAITCKTMGLTGKVICIPNEFVNHKTTIFIVTLIAGVLTGLGPHLIKRWLSTADQLQQQD